MSLRRVSMVSTLHPLLSSTHFRFIFVLEPLIPDYHNHMVAGIPCGRTDQETPWLKPPNMLPRQLPNICENRKHPTSLGDPRTKVEINLSGASSSQDQY